MKDQVAFDIANEGSAGEVGLMVRTIDISSEAMHFPKDQHSNNCRAVM
jgi:hypothetical protein